MAGAEPSSGQKPSLANPLDEVPPERKGPVPNRYIVVLKDTVSKPGQVAERHSENRGARVSQVYRHAIKGYAAELAKGELEAVKRDPAVAYVERDYRGGIAAQTTPTGVERIFAAENEELAINEEEDVVVDVDVAVFDTAIDASHPDLDVVAEVDCLNGCAEEASTGGDHGTHVGGTIAAIDNSFGVVGVAPGARLWSITVLDTGGSGNLSDFIAGIDWVTAKSSQIEVANASLRYWGAEESKAFEASIEASIVASVDAGVVHVVAAGNEEEQVRYVPGNHPEAITVSALADFDGEAGGSGSDECTWWEDSDDTLADFSNYGPLIDIAAPGVCILSTFSGNSYGETHGTSMASPHVAGAAAILASASNPSTGEDVQEIRDTIVEEGNLNWEDDSGDGAHERLLDVGDAEVFSPNEPVDSDVDGDGRADLVTLRGNGVAYVHPGGADAKFGAGVASFEGSPLDPAQYDGEGHYVIDVSDVDGDARSDLVTLSDDGDVHVFKGQADRKFAAGVSSDLELDPGLLKADGHEPIAVADVDGDGRGDLISYHDLANELLVYTGNADATLDAGKMARSGVYSALHAGSGQYFVDAADLNQDGRADLVSMTSGGSFNVFAGKGDGTFAAPVASHAGQIDPAMDDGAGFEPVGLGDSTGDGHADLVLLDNTNGDVLLYPGAANGVFGTSAKAWPHAVLSTTFTEELTNRNQFAGVMDVNGDGRGDLTGTSNGIVYAIKGQTNGTFSEASVSLEGFATTQHFQNQVSGNEMVIEKPAYHRRGCASNGCHHTTASPALVSGIAAATRNGLVDLFYNDASATVAQRWWHQSLGWSGLGNHGSPPGGGTTSEPAATAITSPGSSLHFFVRGADGSIWQKTWIDGGSGSWSAWSSLGGTSLAAAAPAAVSPAAGTLHTFAIATNNTVWRKIWTEASGWGGWQQVPEATATAIGAGFNGAVTLFMRDMEGNMIQRWCCPEPGKWSGPGNHGSPPGGPITSAPAMATAGGTDHVFVRGADRALWEKVWNGSSWSGWIRLGGVLRSGPGAVSPKAGEIHVFARGANDSYWRKRWSAEEGWSQWEPVY